MDFLKSLFYTSLAFWGTILLVGLGYPLLIVAAGLLLVSAFYLGPIILLVVLVCWIFKIPLEDTIERWVTSIKGWFSNTKDRIKGKLNSLKEN